jgi:hypothetical protein
MNQTDIKAEVDTNGFAVREAILSSDEVEKLLLSLERIGQDGPARKRGGVFAIRNLLDASSEIRSVAHSPAVRELVEPILGSEFFPVEVFSSTKFLMQTGKYRGIRT